MRRPQTDYVFSFWTALGWTLLTCGFYGFYVLYQLVRRSRDHNQRRLELLEGANALAWERAHAQGLSEELRPNFERIAAHLAVLGQMTRDFRDPAIWTLISVVASGVAHVVAFILLDGDLIKHDRAEGAIEAELTAIYARLDTPLPEPDPRRVKGPHNYAGRVIAAILTFGIYLLWWHRDMMVELNDHFSHNWPWEDALGATLPA